MEMENLATLLQREGVTVLRLAYSLPDYNQLFCTRCSLATGGQTLYRQYDPRARKRDRGLQRDYRPIDPSLYIFQKKSTQKGRYDALQRHHFYGCDRRSALRAIQDGSNQRGRAF